MNRVILFVAAAFFLGATSALAQSTPPTTTPAPTTPPAERIPATPGAGNLPPALTPARPPGGIDVITKSEEQARAWIDKTVYSSDNRSLGDVAAIQRDAAGKVTELHADVGGFLGIGSTRIRVMPSQFKLEGDRVVLKLNADEIKTLPKVNAAR